ncbi:23332_t:CDS:2, partial [Racocetra persica]
ENEKCCYTIRAGLKRATFVLLEEPVIDEIVIEEYDDERRNRLVDIRNEHNEEHIPDIQIVNEDLKGYRHKFDCIDKTIKVNDNEDSKCEINKKYCNVPDDEKRAIVGIDNHQWDELKIEIDQMLLTLRNNIDSGSSTVKDKYKAPISYQMLMCGI